MGRLLLRDSSVYLVGNLLQKAAAFVLLPIYTNYLSAGQYGLLELANTVVNLMLVGATLGIPHAINKCFHRDCGDEAARRRLIGTAVLFSALAVGVVTAAAWIFEEPLSRLVFSSPEALLVYRYTLIWLVLALMAAIPLEAMRASGRPYAYVGLSIIQLLVQFGLVLYLVRFAGRGLPGVLQGNVAGFLAVNAVAVFLLGRRATWTIDGRLLGAMVGYGLAMVPVFLSGWIVDLSDRFFLQSMVGLGTLGVYSLGYKFGALVNILLGIPLQRAWTPMFFAMADEEGAPRRLTRVATYFFAAGAFCSLGISLAVPVFLRLTADRAFHGASAVVPLVCLAYLISGLANCLGNGLVVAGQVRLISVYAVGAALLNLAFNALLIPWWGMFGAAWATILAFGFQMTAIQYSLNRHYPVPLEWARLAGLTVAGGIPLLASYFLPSGSNALELASRIALLATFPVLVWILRVPHRDEIEVFRRQLVAWGMLRQTRFPKNDRGA